MYDRECTKCPLHKEAHSVCVGADIGKGKKGKDILIIGEAPGYEEDQQGKPFIGRSGQGLRMVLEDLGLEDRAIITNVVKCRPPENRPPKIEEIRKCSGYLTAEIEAYQPKYIVLLGATAIKWATGEQHGLSVGQARGRRSWSYPVNGSTAQVIATYHPAAALRDPDKWLEIGEDLNRLNGVDSFLARETVKVSHLEKAPETLPLKLVFDIETEGLNMYGKGKVLCVGWSNKVGHASVTRDVAGFVQALNPEATLIGHNIKFDLLWLREKYGYVHQGAVIDTMVASHMVDENLPSQSLKHLVHQHTGYGDYSSSTRDFFSLTGETEWIDEGAKILRRKVLPSGKMVQKEVDTFTLLEYCGWDAAVTWKLCGILTQELKREKLTTLFAAEMEVLKLFVALEHQGMGLDLAQIRKVKRTLKARITKIENRLVPVLGDINFDSTQQLVPALRAQGIELAKKTKKGYPSADEESLYSTIERGLTDEQEAIVRGVLERREIKKVVGTYLEPYLVRADPTARLHASFKLTGTKTGRLSCSNPNLQNIPRESEVKGVFIGGKGRSLVWADYSQIELRIGAQITGDPIMLEEIRSGRDIHSSTAEVLFGPNFTKEERSVAKTINFGIFYGAGPGVISRTAKIPMKQAGRLIRDWFLLYKDVKAWMKTMEEQLVSRGYVEDLFGRRRRLPAYVPADDGSRALVVDKAEYGHMLRQACNMPVQGTAGQLTKLAMVSVQRRLPAHAQVISNVHDSILVECGVHKENVCKKVLQSTMEDANGIIREHGFKFTINVPTPVEVGSGPRWE